MSLHDTPDGLLRVHSVRMNLYRNGHDVVPLVPRVLHPWQHPAPLIAIGKPALPVTNVESRYIEGSSSALDCALTQEISAVLGSWGPVSYGYNSQHHEYGTLAKLKNSNDVRPTGAHLDLGCGQCPRNPYGRAELFGVDVHDGLRDQPSIEYRQANLTLQPIPFADDSFDSVSAFDFIEHVPRQVVVGDQLVLPFVNLMDEVWRVLKPNGLFYAVTPAYPSPQAFQDPTHVNIITDKTHEYFCGDEAYGRNYGFKGDFEALRVGWVTRKNVVTADESFRKTLRHWHRRITDGKFCYLLWELRALK